MKACLQHPMLCSREESNNYYLSKLYIPIGIKAINGILNKSNTNHYFTKALVLIWWCNCLLNVHLPVKIFKFCTISRTIFFQSPYFANISLVICTWLSTDRLFISFTIINLLSLSTVQSRILHGALLDHMLYVSIHVDLVYSFPWKETCLFYPHVGAV